MKKVALLTAMIFSGLGLFAQQDTPEEMLSKKEPTRTVDCPVIFVTTSTGINNTTGIIGFSFDVPIAPYVSLEAGTGQSTWGSKLYLGAKYYLRPAYRGLAFSIGLTDNTGNRGTTRTMETIYTTKEPVTLRLYAEKNVLFAVYRYFNLGNQYNRFFIGAGWSINFAGKGWDETSGTPLSNHSIDMINAMKPGGPMAMVGFSFGLSRHGK